jgi:hypothetical protein
MEIGDLVPFKFNVSFRILFFASCHELYLGWSA